MSRISKHNFLQAEHYDKVAEQRLASDLGKQATHAAAKELNEFLNFLGLKKNSSILEIGCGTGGISEQLLKYEIDYYGIDVSQEMLSVFKKKFGANKKV